MLVLEHIKKTYTGDGFNVNALDDVSVSFRKNEFVAVLGPSGSGKTTLLNIIGGLDKYTSGDLIINGKSTKEFTDKDWDSYRNHSVGFVFQSYNLIPHQSVLANVELALTLSGVSRKERRKRAGEALKKVGLGDQLHKKPNQMSGGQMQRVAIARALVNNPDILLADEPTGALDSATSVQIMDLLKEVSRDRLVIMVTHNPELAKQYASRTISVRDGKICADTSPFDGKEEKKQDSKTKKTSMSFFTALSLSLNNLLTKKARTFLTSFAGSIGIIGIALILALSSGIKLYINNVQEDALSSYPLEIQAEEVDMSSLISGIMGAKDKSAEHEKDKVYASSVMYELSNSINNAETKTNDLKKLKEYLEANKEELDKYARAIQYSYNVPLNIYAKTSENKYQKSDITEVFSSMDSDGSSMSNFYTKFSGYKTWAEILPDASGNGVSDVITGQYELVAGAWPEGKEDILLALDQNNEITDITLHALGLKTTEKIIADMAASSRGETVNQETESYEYEDILGLKFKLICEADKYTESDGIWNDISGNSSSMEVIISQGLDLKISGIIRPVKEQNGMSSSASLYYTPALTDYIIDKTNSSEIVKQQQDEKNRNYDVLSGLPFVLENEKELSESERANELKEYFASLSASEKAEMYKKVLSVPIKAETEKTVEEYMSNYPDRASLEKMIFDFYSANADVSEDTIRSFIDGYDDDELRDMVEEQIRDMIKAQREAAAEKTLSEIKAQPSEEELNLICAQILSKLPDRNSKMMYVLTDYAENTAMPKENIYAYLAALDDASLDTEVNRIAKIKARDMYAQSGGDASKADEKAALAFDEYVKTLSEARLSELYDDCMPPMTSSSTLKDNLTLLGAADTNSPSAISIYASTFADKDAIADMITRYNDSASEEEQISYTDYVALIMSSVTTIIDAISYVLIAFVSISLVVSSIMIGIITYISVLERTKEIGILRAIGASKKDVSRVFNAETLIVGFISGLLGILITVALCFPVNAIIRSLSGIDDITAYLPAAGGAILLVISMLLTLVAGLVPSKIAARKDPVAALRSE